MIRSCFVYDGVGKQLIYKWKYNNYYFVKDYIKKIIIRRFSFSNIAFDGVFAVPIHFFRYILRGFNQSCIIADTISEEFNIKDFSGLLKRIKWTKPQALCKNYLERDKNIADAFKLSDKFSGRKILIVDDIITSGSTLNEIAKLFADAEIYMFTIGSAF